MDENRYKNGLLSGWDSISADELVNINKEYSDAKDIYDILDIIRDLRTKYHTDSNSRATLLAHIKDPTAHNLTINLSDADVISMLYNEYKARYGERLTKEQFVVSMFNVNELATREDYDNGEEGLLMNLGLAKEIIDEHLNETNPHPQLHDAWYPGEPILTLPSLTFHGGITTKLSVDYRRDGVMYCHGINGDFIVYDADEIPVDYLNGTALTPVFKETHNRINSAESIGNAVLTGASRFPTTSVSFKNPRYGSDMLILGATAVTSEHSFENPLIVANGETVNLSVYFRRLNAYKGFELSVGGFAIKVIDNTLTLPAGVTGNIFNFNNRWSRVDFGFTAVNDISKAICKLIKDDSTTFLGDGLKAFAFYLLQVTNTLTVTPPLPGGMANKIFPSTFTFTTVGDLWNNEAGIISIKLFGSSSPKYFNASPIIACFDDNLNPTIIVYENNSKVQVASYNRDNSLLTEIDLGKFPVGASSAYKYLTFGYTGGHQCYGITNSKPHMLDYYSKHSSGSKVKILTVPQEDLPIVDAPCPYEYDDRDNTNEYSINNVDLISLFGNGTNCIDAYVSRFNYFREGITLPKAEFLLNQHLGD